LSAAVFRRDGGTTAGGAGSAESAVDLMEAFFSGAKRLSRGEARRRRRATRALDSLLASDVLHP
jgi:hypothetical protein